MKILITQDTFAPSLDGPALLSANETVDIEPDNGHALVVAGKGLYVDQKDAKGRPAHLVATAERLRASTEAQAAADKTLKTKGKPEA